MHQTIYASQLCIIIWLDGVYSLAGERGALKNAPMMIASYRTSTLKDAAPQGEKKEKISDLLDENF